MEHQEPVDEAQARARAERAFYEKLFGSLGIIAMLFVIDLATGGGWWFFWPALGLSIALIVQAARLFSPANRFNDAWEQRRAEDIRTGRGKQAASPPLPPAVREFIRSGEASVADLRVQAGAMTKPEVRAQAERICDRASQILRVLAEPGRDVQLAREFAEQVLEPATTVFTNYVRLSERQIAGAQPALARVETHDLPIIERTLEDLNQRLHRSDIVSLEVASEMLDLGRVNAEAAELPARGAP